MRALSTSLRRRWALSTMPLLCGWYAVVVLWCVPMTLQSRAHVTAETTMYDYDLMKLPQDVVMSVRALVSAIEADPHNSVCILKKFDRQVL